MYMLGVDCSALLYSVYASDAENANSWYFSKYDGLKLTAENSIDPANLAQRKGKVKLLQ